MNKEHKDAFEIFFDRIERDAIYDLNRMLDLVDYNNSQGRLVVPIALTIFSLLDLFGFIVSKNNDVKQTSKNLRTAFETLFSKEIKQHEREILIELYRNGVVHSFYPKSCGIRNDNKGFAILSYGRERFHLNVNPFAELLIVKLRSYVLESKKDQNEVKRLNERINLLVNTQSNDFKSHESNLPKSNTTQTVITTTILVLPPEETSPPKWQT